MVEARLEMLQALVQKVLDEQAASRRDREEMRDDLRVMSAILMRQDNTLAGLLTEVRAMHFGQVQRHGTGAAQPRGDRDAGAASSPRQQGRV